MRKLLSLRHWSHVFKIVSRLLLSPKVLIRDKLILLVPAVLYWILPDVIPFLPIDDIAVTMGLAHIFATNMEKKYPYV